MASYQTRQLAEYGSGFQEVARDVAERLRTRIGERLKEFDGSYSIVPRNSNETAAKIIIYEPHLGKENRPPFPLRHPGVYVLIRHNGEVGQGIWNQLRFSPNLLERCDRRSDIGVAPKHDERFYFFPVMAGESLQRIADLLVEIAGD